MRFHSTAIGSRFQFSIALQNEEMRHDQRKLTKRCGGRETTKPPRFLETSEVLVYTVADSKSDVFQVSTGERIDILLANGQHDTATAFSFSQST